MQERREIHERYLAHLISDSQARNFYQLFHAKNINCYGAARMLTYPDKQKHYYAPGMLSKLATGIGSFLHGSIDLNHIDSWIQADSKILNQTVEKISFEEINSKDTFHYFAFCKMQAKYTQIEEPGLKYYLKDYDDSQTPVMWHFIFRTNDGTWMHKPNFDLPIEPILGWETFGKSFYFDNYSFLLGGILVPTEVTCLQFYRTDFKFNNLF